MHVARTAAGVRGAMMRTAAASAMRENVTVRRTVMMRGCARGGVRRSRSMSCCTVIKDFLPNDFVQSECQRRHRCLQNARMIEYSCRPCRVQSGETHTLFGIT